MILACKKYFGRYFIESISFFINGGASSQVSLEIMYSVNKFLTVKGLIKVGYQCPCVQPYHLFYLTHGSGFSGHWVISFVQTLKGQHRPEAGWTSPVGSL
ncbi:hypothetical protein CHT99_01160 [Sphingobacterium cellulitidis]|nr:hypothetical protein CHT99_01160 [Sphingobacterium cellulitidis]